ncbi:MAG: hypothetical protein Q4G19_02760 [Clostridia bacterium]|nr:hypothetical protein [Clostridia bacterium]
MIDIDLAIGNQTLFLSIAPDNVPMTLSVNIRYHNAAARHFITITDILTGDVLLNNIPLVPSGTRINDLLATARHRLPGTLFLLPDGTTLIWMDRQTTP